MKEVINVGSRREVFWDEYLLDMEETTAKLVLHRPVPREVVMVHDEPWEGDGCDYHNILRDGDLYRMYYLGWSMLDKTGTKHGGCPIVVCYAESLDGKTWVKPNLGLCSYNGFYDNNIILDSGTAGFDNFYVLIDGHPACPPQQRYKGVGMDTRDGYLWCFTSADGIRFQKAWPMTNKGKFDSLNIAAYDRHSQRYICWLRDFHKVPGDDLNAGIRDIRVMFSEDFKNWSDPVLVDFGEGDDYPLYTSAAQIYHRAEHMFIGFPSRYAERLEWTDNFSQLPGAERRRARMQGHPRYGLSITDCVFMSSRDGRVWKRWDEAFLTPGPEEPYNWVYGDCYPAAGIVETDNDRTMLPGEMSMYLPEGHWSMKPTKLRRYTLRTDGFVSCRGDYKPCVLLTKPFIFSGSKLFVNFSTSAVGFVKIRLSDGVRTIESDELFGDSCERRVGFGETDIAKLGGRPVVMRIVMRDADLYSFRFSE